MARRSVLASLRTASNEKLVRHYNNLLLAYRETDDYVCQVLIVETQMGVAEELLRRGIETPMASAMRTPD
jgi:hypothetical protein